MSGSHPSLKPLFRVNDLVFSATSVGMPARRPLSTSAFLTQSFSVCRLSIF